MRAMPSEETGRIFRTPSFCSRGLTILEMLLILAVIGILAQLATSSYMGYIDRTRVAQAVTDIAVMSTLIMEYQRERGIYPAGLVDIGNRDMSDPWGRPYVYLNLTTVRGNGMSRRDRNLNPLNSDFDLYSKGKNGLTQMQISNHDSLDDVIRANDGAFINLASKYSR